MYVSMCVLELGCLCNGSYCTLVTILIRAAAAVSLANRAQPVADIYLTLNNLFYSFFFLQ